MPPIPCVGRRENDGRSLANREVDEKQWAYIFFDVCIYSVFDVLHIYAILRSMNGTQKQSKDNKYNPSQIEPHWQSVWLKEKLYQPDLENAKKPFYNLHMFPYPSAEGLHVGNVYAFTGADIYGRFKRMQGYDVFQPFGLDGFGIHSENYALKVGSHPMDQAEKSEKRFYKQVESLGSGYDWSHLLETYKPNYYKWTQWIFIELFKAGLAYRENVAVNFCPSCKTVLADEQVIDGQCERCGSLAEKRDLKQWMFRITKYAEQLLDGINRIDWTEKVKLAQKNWIGKSEGAKIKFKINDERLKINEIEVFTTRPDTLYGATFLVVSPEYPVVENWLDNPGVRGYVTMAKLKSEQERIAEGKEKTGVFTGAYAINPINNQQMPIWIADYVLMSYGTGAIMAVPAHDERDYAFARKYELPIAQVVEGGDVSTQAYVGPGKLINSGEWNGLQVPEAKQQVIADIEKKGIGSGYINYHLRDWLISRQRYWGPPIPMVFCQACADRGDSWFTSEEGKKREKISNFKFQISNKPIGNWTLEIGDSAATAVGWYPEENLPVELPYIEDYKPLGIHLAGSLQSGGQAHSPLGNHPEFYEVACPRCGGAARRETDVSDTFLDSSWYFLGYLATDTPHIPFPSQAFAESSGMTELHPRMTREEVGELSLEIEKAVARLRWLPVTIYTGGAEHSVLHLLYTRFLYKVLCDLGYIDRQKGDEPFPRFFAHGLIIKDGAKMSKSKGNVVVPDEYIQKFGADTLRTYLMFLGPFNMGGDFRDSGIEGMFRFIKRVWILLTGQTISSTPLDPAAKSEMHKAIRGVTEDIDNFRYNTAIAKIMTYYNFLSKRESVSRGEAKVLLQLLAPFAPHMTEELWQRLKVSEVSSVPKVSKASDTSDTFDTPDTFGTFQSIHTSGWPEFDPSAIAGGEVVIAVQVNGKLRGTITLQSAERIAQSDIEELAQKEESVAKYIEGKTIQKTIYVPGKILNFVVS